MTLSLEYAEKFWAKVRRGASTECWPYGGYCDDRGYGIFSWAHRERMKAHRAALYFATGTPIPSDVVVRHGCDNPPCCNPLHLELGTQVDNVRDRDSRLRQTRGARHPRAKLNEEAVRRIRNDARSAAAVAREYGVSRSAISDIRNGKNWRVL